MRKSWPQEFRDPVTGRSLEVHGKDEEGDGIVSGSLVSGNSEYRVVRGIPRFCPEENYADSFGWQWNEWNQLQLDSAGQWGDVSERRLFEDSQWPRSMVGERILEAGSGMGRFTEILAKTGARVCTFDYSQAVDANFANNGHYDNLVFAQGDIYAPPYEPESFDKVLCIGVLQHCPSPKKAFLSLARFVKPGGEIVVDLYRLNWRCLLLGKYYIRPITRRMSTETLHRFVNFHVGWVYPLTGFVQKLIGRRGRSLSWLLAMADHRGLHADPDSEAAKELSLLDTFDMLAPAYDRPQTIGGVRGWLREAGLEEVSLRAYPGYFAIRGRKPTQSGASRELPAQK